jgi:hypothetical protein
MTPSFEPNWGQNGQNFKKLPDAEFYKCQRFYELSVTSLLQNKFYRIFNQTSLFEKLK